ncbi:MAG: hypothetical protein WCV91_02490 [Candidatus Margulisiibacteriota bacterium]
MKKLLLSLVLVSLVAGMSLSLELTGKTGFGLRADTFSIRRFVNNNFGVDLNAFYNGSTQSGQADSNLYSYALGGFYAREIYSNTLLEIGATLQGWQGSDAGANFNGLMLNPFVGAECFINDHFAIDGKIFLGAYGSAMQGAIRSTSISLLDGNLGAHIYF